MKRTRINNEVISHIEASSKKIHYPIEVKDSKERIYRCTYPLCNFIACTPHNVIHHAEIKHSTKESKENIID